MTRDEAIQWLTNEKWENANNKYKKEWNEAFEMAIEALSVANLKEEFESAEYEDYEHATLVDIKEPLKPSADAEPIVIRAKTLLPTKDFKEWAKRIREVNPNAVVIPCDSEVASADAVPQLRQTDTLIIADAFMK